MFQGIDTAEYDFLVVGAGIAGSVVASRLSENPDWTVLLFEAGPEEPTATQVPAFAMSAVGSELDWKYQTQPQDTACLATGGVCNWPRGKAQSRLVAKFKMVWARMVLSWVPRISKNIFQPPSSSRCQKGEMKQVTY